MNRDARRLEAAIDVTERAAERLRSSIIDDSVALDRAIADDTVVTDKDLLRALDAFVQRFQQLHEHMTQRLYPAIYRAEELGARPPPAKHLFVWLEGLGVLDSAKSWAERAEIRNRLVHEYPLDEGDRAIALRAAVAESSAMLEELDRALGHIMRRTVLERDDD